MLVYDVTDYGATGDGSTDDTDETQAAISAASGSSPGGVYGATVFFPQGKYLISDKLQPPKHVNLIGESRAGSIILQTAQLPAIYMDVTAVSGDPYSFEDGWYNTIAELTLQFSGTAGEDTHGIQIDNEVSNKNCGFQNYRNIGIKNFWDGVRLTRPIVCRFEQVEAFSGTGNGFTITSGSSLTTGGTSVIFINTFAHDNAHYGYEISGGFDYVVFDGTACDTNTLGGYYVHTNQGLRPSSVVLNGTGAEKNGGRQYSFQGVRGLTLNSIFVNGPTASDDLVLLDDVTLCAINGTYISQTPSSGDALHMKTNSQAVMVASHFANKNVEAGSSLTIITDQDGNITADDVTANGEVAVIGNVTGNRFISTVATGTAPFACTSTTKNTHLNADLLDDLEASDFVQVASPATYFHGSSASDFYLRANVTGDSNPRFRVYADGSIFWGPGNAALDVSLVRDAFAHLSLGAGLKIAGTLDLSAHNVSTDTTTGTQIGTASGQKLGFFGHSPNNQNVLATGAMHSVDDVIAELQRLGLVRQS